MAGSRRLSCRCFLVTVHLDLPTREDSPWIISVQAEVFLKIRKLVSLVLSPMHSSVIVDTKLTLEDRQATDTSHDNRHHLGHYAPGGVLFFITYF